ncbi:hypothetical protein [Streptosporangium canum]
MSGRSSGCRTWWSTAITLTPEVAFSLNIPIDLHDTPLLAPET